MSSTISSILASKLLVRDEAAARAFEQVVIARPALRANMASNPALTRDGWARLAKKPNLATALALVDRHVPREIREPFLAHETRSRVITALLERNSLTPDEVELLVTAKELKPSVAEELLIQLADDRPELARELAIRAGGIPLLEWLADAHGPDAASVRTLVSTFPSWKPARS